MYLSISFPRYTNIYIYIFAPAILTPSKKKRIWKKRWSTTSRGIIRKIVCLERRGRV